MDRASLVATDWLDLALAELLACGYGALKAQPLAKKLNVTRGSFYHHFDSLEDFHEAVIDHWSERTSGQLIRVAQGTADPPKALDELLQKTLQSGEGLERAIRSWSTVDARVARAVEKVDQDRIAVAVALLVANDVPMSDAQARAQLLYWAAIGRLMLPFPDNNQLSRDQISDIAQLMLE